MTVQTLGHDDPFHAFAAWYDAATRAEPDVPNAMTLATASADGRPSARMVLMKGASPEGVEFYTNLSSRKAHDLAQNPYAAVVFHWKSLQRQVQVEGRVEALSAARADEYWATRPRGSQLGAWASLQSESLDAWEALSRRLEEQTERFGEGPVPRPPFWTGFLLVPSRFEFWQGRPDRLHHRWEFQREGDAWVRRMLYP